MKKRLLLIVCCVLVLVFCVTALISCKNDDNTLDEATLESLLKSAKDGYAETASVTSNFTVASTVTRYNEETDTMDTANIQWTPSDSKVSTTVADGLVTVVVPASRAEDLTFTLTAVLVDADGKAYKRADGTEYSFTITRTAKATNAAMEAANSFYEKIVKEPQVGVAYKAVVFKEYTAWYFAGTTESGKTYRYNTTFNYNESPDVYLEQAEGGYYLYFMNGTTKTYIDIMRNGTSASTGFVTDKANLKGVYTIHETAGCLYGTVKDGDKTYNHYLGMRGQYLPSIAAVTDTKPLNDGTLATGYKYTDNPVFLVSEDVSYKQDELTEAEVLAKAKALGDNEEIAGRYSLTGVVTQVVPNGTYTDIDVYMNLTLDNTEVMCYRLNKGSSLHEGDTIKVTGVIKKYKKDADTDAIIEFIAYAHYEIIKKAPVQVPSNVDKATTLAADTDYKIAIDSEDKVAQYYLLNKMDTSQTNYVAATTNVLTGVNFRVEAVDGGYKIYWLDGETKKYVGAKLNGTYNNLVLNVADAQTVWTIDENGIHITLGEKEVYMGLRGSYTTVGLYTEGDDIWKAYLGTVKPEALKATITVTNDANADIAVDKQTATIGETVTITVTPKNDYTLSEVLVNGKAITAVEGVYSFVVEKDSVVSVTMISPSGEAPKGTTAENPYTVAEAIAIAKALEGAASNQTVYNDKPVYVKGYVVSVSAQDNFDIADTIGGTSTLQFYKGAFDEGVTGIIYINDEVVLYGYIANYSAGWKSELVKNNDVTPLVKSITVGNSSIAQATSEDYTITFSKTSGVNGDKVTFTVVVNADGKEVQAVTVTNGTATYSEENSNYEVTLNGNMVVTVELKDAGSKEEKIVLDLTKAANTGIDTAAGNTTVATTTINGVEVTYLNCKQYSGYLMVCKPAGTTSAGYLIFKVSGTIKSITITTTSGASAAAQYIVLFSDSELDGVQTGTATPISNSTTKEFTCDVEDATYFYIGLTKSTANKDVNGQLATIEIVYEPAE